MRYGILRSANAHIFAYSLAAVGILSMWQVSHKSRDKTHLLSRRASHSKCHRCSGKQVTWLGKSHAVLVSPRMCCCFQSGQCHLSICLYARCYHNTHFFASKPVASIRATHFQSALGLLEKSVIPWY